MRNSNAWRKSIAPLISDEGVRHAMMAFASTYVLDYVRDESMRKRAMNHYQIAVRILNKRIEEANNGVVDDQRVKMIVGSIILLNAHDVSVWSRGP